MLAGLIFATEEAEDRPDTLAATLPFGGMTLLEYQIRLMLGAGAGQVLVAVARVTPALLGAVARAAKRGVPIDVVRSAEEAATKVHPLARVLVMADGLVTTDPVMDRMAVEGAEALLVTDDPDSRAAIERVDMRDCWAGLMRLPAHHLAAIARMPADYDFQSALLRVAVQSRAEHVPLTSGWLRSGHAVEHTAAALASRTNAVLAALTERRTNWADRWVFTRIARLVLPDLVSRAVPGVALTVAGGVLALGAAGAVLHAWPGIGALVSLLALCCFATAGAMAALRGEERRAGLNEGMIAATFGLIALLVGWMTSRSEATTTPVVLAVVAVALQLLVERAPARPRRWWASPSALLLLLTPFALVDFAEAGLGAIAIYAFSTLAAAVEASREKA